MSTTEFNLGNSVLNFSVDLYKNLCSNSEKDGNVFYSPFSIAAALSMALAGARHNTAKQLSSVLHAEDDKVHSHFSTFLSKIPDFAPDVTLDIANRMYAEKTFHILEDYLALLQTSYNSTLKSVDFLKEADKVRLEVNHWVEEVTKSKIRDLLQPGSVDNRTALILVNAIYFKGLWEYKFRPDATRPHDFHLARDKKTTVDMMYQKGHFRMGHSADLDVTALEISYKGSKTSMVILLPNDTEGLSSLEENLTASKLSNLIGDLGRASNVKLFLPKFKLEQSIPLKSVLTSMGVKDLFTRVADLSGISSSNDLYASNVIHKAFVDVNEEGTEAAAATAAPIRVKCAARSLPVEISFVVDHPFMFVIRSLDPEVILFMGSLRQL